MDNLTPKQIAYEIKDIQNKVLSKEKRGVDASLERNLLKEWAKVKGWEKAGEMLNTKKTRTTTRRTRTQIKALKERKGRKIPRHGNKAHQIKTTSLDKLFSQFVRLLADGECKRCHKKVGYKLLQNAHFHSRRKQTVRFDRLNTQALCAGCHFLIDQNPVEKYEFFRGLMTSKEFDGLNRIANLTIKDYPIDKDKLEKKFKEGIKKLNG
jgi:hypothetical protein